MKPILTGALSGGVALFAWNMVANALPFHPSAIRALSSDAPLVEALTRLDAEPGTYFVNRLPGKLGVGPGYWGWMTIHRSADYAFLPSLLRGFGAQVVIALCLSLLLRAHGPSTFGRRWLMVMATAVAAFSAGAFTYWNWSWFSGPYLATQAFDLFVGWALAGAVLARLVPPSSRSR